MFANYNNRFLKVTVPQFSDNIYYGHFRMTRDSMDRLIQFSKTHSNIPYNWGGGESVMSLQEMIHIAVWFLANQYVMREVSVKFSRTISSVRRAIDRVTSMLEKITPIYQVASSSGRYRCCSCVF